MSLVTQFSTMGGPLEDPWIWAYPQHWLTSDLKTTFQFDEMMFFAMF